MEITLFNEVSTLTVNDSNLIIKKLEKELSNGGKSTFITPHANNVIALHIAESPVFLTTFLLEKKIFSADNEQDKIFSTIQVICAMYFVAFICNYYDKFGTSDSVYRFIDIKIKYQRILSDKYLNFNDDDFELFNSNNSKIIYDLLNMIQSKKFIWSRSVNIEESFCDSVMGFVYQTLNLPNKEIGITFCDQANGLLHDYWKEHLEISP